jgi:hypothetical protein
LEWRGGSKNPAPALELELSRSGLATLQIMIEVPHQLGCSIVHTSAYLFKSDAGDLDRKPKIKLSAIEQTSLVSAATLAFAQSSGARWQGDDDMLGIIAAVLIILWLLGFFAFHVTAAFIHIVLVVGLVLLVLHFMRGRAV